MIKDRQIRRLKGKEKEPFHSHGIKLATCAMFAMLLAKMKSSKLSTSLYSLQGSIFIQQEKKFPATVHSQRHAKNNT